MKVVHAFGTLMATLGSFGVGACTVALIVALVHRGDVCAALAVGVFLSAALVYVGDLCKKLAALNAILEGDGHGDQ